MFADVRLAALTGIISASQKQSAWHHSVLAVPWWGGVEGAWTKSPFTMSLTYNIYVSCNLYEKPK